MSRGSRHVIRNEVSTVINCAGSSTFNTFLNDFHMLFSCYQPKLDICSIIAFRNKWTNHQIRAWVSPSMQQPPLPISELILECGWNENPLISPAGSCHIRDGFLKSCIDGCDSLGTYADAIRSVLTDENGNGEEFYMLEDVGAAAASRALHFSDHFSRDLPISEANRNHLPAFSFHGFFQRFVWIL